MTNKKIYENCVENEWDCDTSGATIVNGFTGRLGRISLERDSVERPPQPAREETTEATYKEYNQCLREHGI